MGLDELLKEYMNDENAIPDRQLHDESYELVAETKVMSGEIKFSNEEEEMFSDSITTRNNYKSKINYYDDVNKPIFAIFFNFFNWLSHRRSNEGEDTFEGVTFKGIMDSDNTYVDYLPDYPPMIFEFTVIINIGGNDISVVLLAYKEALKVRNIIRLSSLDDDNIKSHVIYDKLFQLAVETSNLKGSYLTVTDEHLEWKIRELKDLTFNDVFLPDELMDDLKMYVQLYEKKGIMPRYMFSGVPGTGKTEITRAISNILNQQGVTVIKTNICKIIKQKFDLAKILAPCIMILDDIDLYLGDRNQGAYSPLLGAFLDILDGVDKLPDDVGVIASTNAPHLIDLAAQRPGRFDKLLFFDELTSDNIRDIINKSLDKMDAKFNNITEKDRNILTDSKLVDYFKKAGSTGAYIHEVVQDIKNKSEILEKPLDLEKIIAEITKRTQTLDEKLKTVTIKNNLKTPPNFDGY